MANNPDPDSPTRRHADDLWQPPRSQDRAATSEDTQRLLQQLEIHQIELELQNAELRRARAESEASLELYTLLYDFAPVAYFNLDPLGTVLRANFAGARLLGVERGKLAGQRFGLLVEVTDRPGFAGFLDSVFSGEGKGTCEVMLACVGATPILAHIEGRRAEPGLECRVVVEDITERERSRLALEAAKAEAERANTAKSRFLAAASHDLRQPLLALGMYIDALGLRLPPEEAPHLVKMKACLSGLSSVLSNLLELSKLEAGVTKPEARDFVLEDLLRQLAMAHAPNAQSKGLSLRYRPTRLTGHTDPSLFMRMIGNLLANAVRYTERGGILLGCRRRRGKMWVEVWDTGIGLREDQIGGIFEEFRQIGNPEHNPNLGHGLGLSIVAKSAALLGLDIRVGSRPGRGSLFALELPLGGQIEPTMPRTLAHRALRIGLVDDNSDVRDSLVCALESAGHQLVDAATGEKLLARLARSPPDIVISDHHLNGSETGLDVIQSARAVFGGGLPALILTGDTDPSIIRAMAEWGISVQYKPLDLDTLIACISELTGGGK